jgi:two-component system, chemotaxis family, sensor kinase Cph1
VIQAYSDSVSHDLRTPLRFVSRIAYLLLNDPALPLTEKVAQQVNLIMQATTEMGKLIENLLVFSHVGRTPMKQNTVNIRRLFQEAARESDIALGGKQVTFDIQEMDPCVGDRLLLKEVAINLIGNAIKFTRKQDEPQITVGSTRSGSETVYFVRDNGVGFDMNRYDSLFLPFQRLHKSTDFEGSGIGLALVRRIIERHGGRIWATSEIEQGTTFCFTLGNGNASAGITQEKEPGS